MQLSPGEIVVFSVSPKFEPLWPHCECGQVAYRIVGSIALGNPKETPLCAQHFLEASIHHPVLPYMEQPRSSECEST
jgi:hypothetical protein